ncbi:phosphatidylinositol alpha-mannosyltransferase [Crossiella equi]|uniref:Phosphatidylinositol alpha-mannosyltransferase n=1 Tax=Crossiella equi TaxID=130796 RepID=A0ABS5ANJ7_9PSEU|nr:glycosyltransferase family 4 protein [Crossiella equi]MBP2478141.1 phosphatidylinositol alpha-mannosyltransferase [Crossiella equi]
MRIGLVCPYSLDVPGGVQSHVLALAAHLRGLGHTTHVLAPGTCDGLPPYVRTTGGSVAVPYNGSVARLAFGRTARRQVRDWLSGHEFDLLHLHEPTAPSLALHALSLTGLPVVTTSHTSSPSRLARHALRPLLSGVAARIVVSASARLPGEDAVEIPNGVDLTTPSARRREDTVVFLGRFDEPRKGLPVLLAAARQLPGTRVVVAGTGRTALPPGVTPLGPVDEAAKARLLAGATVFCAPNLGGESFGMVLTEAMAAGAPVVASDLPAFRAVLGGAGELVPPGDPGALATALAALLADPARRARLAARGRRRVRRFGWPLVARRVAGVYADVLDRAVPWDRAC